MQKSKVHILSTRPLDEALVATAAKEDIAIETLSFIETAPVTDAATTNRIKDLATQPITVIFTSMNAVEMVADQVATKVPWTVYCIGSTTNELVQKKLQVPVKGTAAYAEALAEVIINDGVKEAYFLCGNIRRDTLPDKLRQARIALEEIVVYHTTETAQRVLKVFDGVLFFSPSAVHSFFSNNAVTEGTTYFAIGTTTAAAIQQYTNNNVIVAEKPGKEELVQLAIRHFSQHKIK